LPSPNEILAAIDDRISDALSLSVGRMVDGDLEANHLTLSTDAAEGLREQCQVVRTRIADSTAVPYTATAELNTGECFVIDDPETLSELGPFRDLAQGLAAFPQIAPADLDLSIKLYAVSVGDQAERVVFVQRTNPRMTHRSGRFLAIGQQQLTRVEGPVFSFSPDFDFVVGTGWVVVLDQRAFEMLFREVGLVEKHINSWISGITDHLPMSSASVDSLRSVALRDSRTWRRLRDIERRGHLAHVGLDQVGEYAANVGLDPKKVIVGGALVFDPAERFGFLHLLNEDLYTGPLTGEAFESQRKATMD